MKNNNSILFVDDEKNILKTIRRQFFSADFTIHLADSAQKGIEILEKNKVDIVVSDVKMPQMDGIEFLKNVKRKFPSVHRVILSGYVEKENVTKALMDGIATTYFAKPWDQNLLKKRIMNLFELHASLKNTNFRKVDTYLDNMPVFSSVYRELLIALDKNESLGTIEEIIERDIGLTTKILHIANSAFYAAKKIYDLESAIKTLGTETIKAITFSAKILDQLNEFKGCKNRLEDLMFKENLINFYVKKYYYKIFSNVMPIRYSLLPILMNVGKFFLLAFFENDFDKISKGADIQDESFYDKENELKLQDFDHCKIGAFILDIWDIPDEYVEAAMFHHNPERLDEEMQKIIKLCNTIDYIIDSLINDREIDYEKLFIKEKIADRIIEEIKINLEGRKNEK